MLQRITYSICACALLIGLSGVASAGPAIPPTQSNIDSITYINRLFYTMVDQHIDLMVTEGIHLLIAIGVIFTVYYSLLGMFGDTNGMMKQLIELLFMFTIFLTMLQFYDVPMPFSSVSFHQIFYEEARWAAGMFDLGTVNDASKLLMDVLKNLPTPRWTDGVLGLVIIPFIFVSVVLAWVLLQYTTLIAYIALGLGGLIGPLLIPFGLWPFMSWLFNGWFRFMCTYAMYLIFSSALVYVFAHVLMYSVSGLANGDYTIGHVLINIVPFLALVSAFAVAFWQAHSWARDIAHGTASAGAGLTALAQSAVSYVLRK